MPFVLVREYFVFILQRGEREKEFPIDIQEIGGRERVLSYNYKSKKIKLPYILHAPEDSLLS